MDASTFNQLAKSAGRGNGQDYRLLLEASAALIRGHLAAKMSGALRADIEDIVQETLLSVHTKFNSYNPTLPFLPWLRTIANHKLVDHWRRRKISETVAFDESFSETLAAPVQDSDSCMTLERLMENLSDKQKTIVRAARIEGHSMQEISQNMNISVIDAKVTLHRALRKLADIVRENAL